MIKDNKYASSFLNNVLNKTLWWEFYEGLILLGFEKKSECENFCFTCKDCTGGNYWERCQCKIDWDMELKCYVVRVEDWDLETFFQTTTEEIGCELLKTLDIQDDRR